ncbi:FAD-dependent oxidoreductase [Bacillus piscicola]|uniref:FAD-dependent oxidoreductase n=1 Tax=Bacillus piscicola TaxID=1632684 RepID=UPI001F08F3C2|nr:FAD-dependent oxidoreductase [Bacillus piscicola]
MTEQTNGRLPKNPEPLWREDMDIPEYTPLEEHIETDVVVVGAGITGLTSAYLLAKEGLNVTVLEAGRILNGTTGHTTAKITAQHGLIYDELIQNVGQSQARLYYEANKEALDFIKETVNEDKIECDFKEQDAYLYATTERSASKIEKEYEAYQKLRIGGDLGDQLPFSIQVSRTLRMKSQAQFHPLRYLSQLAEQVKKNGGNMYEQTTAVNIDKQDGKRIVHTRNEKRVTADFVLVCSHFPFYEGSAFYSARMYADRSYILGVKTKHPYPGGMYLSVDQPNRSLRSAQLHGEEIVLIGGESHKTGQGKDTMKHYQALEKFGQDVFEMKDIAYRWSAQDLTTLDKLPYIGELSPGEDRVLIATGFRKWGMTNGTAAALMFRDLVLGKKSPYVEVFSPSRFNVHPSLKNFLVENGDVAKHLMKGKLDVPDRRPEDVAKGEGKIVSIKGHRKGAYRDENGELFVVDTTCTHVGCEVEWNSGDCTWDCPCHGSRFSYKGDVIEGPAEKPLQQHDHTIFDNFTSEDSGY